MFRQSTSNSRVIGLAHPNPELSNPATARCAESPSPRWASERPQADSKRFHSCSVRSPEGTGPAFVPIQHLDPRHESTLGEILAQSRLCLSKGCMTESGSSRTISMQSLQTRAWSYRTARCGSPRGCLVCICRPILFALAGTGSGQPGDQGRARYHLRSGRGDGPLRRYAEERIATGAIEYVLPPAEIGRELGRIAHHRFLVIATPGVAQSETLSTLLRCHASDCLPVTFLHDRADSLLVTFR